MLKNLFKKLFSFNKKNKESEVVTSTSEVITTANKEVRKSLESNIEKVDFNQLIKDMKLAKKMNDTIREDINQKYNSFLQSVGQKPKKVSNKPKKKK